VMRKSGPVVRIKQPDRDKALRALEKVHERLDKLNEQHYAKLEKEGRLPSLEEIERMDAGAATEPANDFAQKPQVLSGSATGATSATPVFAEKPQELSGSPAPSDQARQPEPAPRNTEEPQVLSGSATAIAAATRALAEKPKVLSGAWPSLCEAAMDSRPAPLKQAA